MNQSEEIWKDILGYEGLYQVSTLGRVRSVDRAIYQQGRIVNYKGVLMTPYIMKNGYTAIRLSKNGKKHNYLIHRLVAISFVKNANNEMYVNHIDENKTNNNADNLEWCSREYNINYGTSTMRRAKKMGTKIVRYDKHGNFIDSFYSIREAERCTKISRQNIISVLDKNLTGGGYVWRKYTGCAPLNISVSIPKNSSKEILQYSVDGKFIAKYKSSKEMETLTNFKRHSILACCRGILNSAYGYKWRYV